MDDYPDAGKERANSRPLVWRQNCSPCLHLVANFCEWLSKAAGKSAERGEGALNVMRACIAGVGAYNYFLKEVPLRKMFLWTAVLGTLLGLTQLILITGKPLAATVKSTTSRKS